jgi:hypothetical protein
MGKGKGKKSKEGGVENRQHPRVPLDMLVQVRSDSIQQFREVHAKNISVGGMFIAAAPPSSAAPGGGAPKRANGDELYFQFTVKDGGTLIEGMGKVVHVSDAGLGVEFTSVLEPSASIIRALVDERLRASA